MPIYEYRCRACQRDFERYVPTAAAAAVGCPHCASDNVMRKLSVFGMKTDGASVASSLSGGGGCCGGGCSCH
jgi:putative FmdB family regulatory protein